MVAYLLTLLFLYPQVMPKKSHIEDGYEYQCALMEYNGYIKNVCQLNGSDSSYFRCFNSDIYYRKKIKLKTRCPEDPSFYQVCGIVDVGNHKETTAATALCRAFLCHDNVENLPFIVDKFKIISVKNNYENQICNGIRNCVNTFIDEEHCDRENRFSSLISGEIVAKHLICNGECDSYNCEDEARCNGVKYGVHCYPALTYSPHEHFIPPHMMCTGKENCRDGQDEKDCSWDDENGQLCQRRERDPAVTEKMRCFPGFAKCSNYMDQTNCTDLEKVGLRCLVKGYLSSVSKFVVCKGKPQLCDDNFENLCEQVTASCLVHKHRICDGTSDCQDNSDETHPACLQKTERMCERHGKLNEMLPIPHLWLMDGFTDCTDGEDETRSIWSTCGYGPTLRFSSESRECMNVFLCRGGDSGYVEVDFLCDGVESCGFENNVCSVSRNFPNIYTDLSNTIQQSQRRHSGWVYHMSFCVKGMAKIQSLAQNPCLIRSFRFPDHDTFGINRGQESYLLPLAQSTCDHVYGENYVFRSCNNACNDSVCPLTVIPNGSSCPMQFHQRVKTYAKGPAEKDLPYLAMLWRTRGWFTNRIFVCSDNLRCLPYSKVCDLVADCSDGSDEAACTNHYQCETTSQFIPKTQKCDGEFHCLDLSDECNDECSRELLSGVGKKIAAWLLGCISTVFNTFVIIRAIYTTKESKSIRSMTNKVLVLLINTGDLLIGVYLLSVASMDIIFKDNYCLEQTEWLKSSKCTIVGVVNTIGSQISLISMTMLSIIRARSVSKSLVNASPGLNMKNLLVLLLQTFSIVLGSVALAITPIIPSLEDFFVNGLHHDPKYKVFIGFLDKDDHFEVLSRYYGRMQKKTLKWKLIKKMVKDMFSKDYGMLKDEKLDFYGNDATCMFKYFVTLSDPQRQFTWSVLALNFSCFIAIALAYLIISSVSKHSTANVGDRFRKRHKATQRKISAIILTDCICWIPFIVIAMIHSIGLVDATKWYSVFSVIILPINSVINPFLYDDLLSQTAAYIFIKIFKSTKKKNHEVELDQMTTDQKTRLGISGAYRYSQEIVLNNIITVDTRVE